MGKEEHFGGAGPKIGAGGSDVGVPNHLVQTYRSVVQFPISVLLWE